MKIHFFLILCHLLDHQFNFSSLVFFCFFASDGVGCALDATSFTVSLDTVFFTLGISSVSSDCEVPSDFFLFFFSLSAVFFPVASVATFYVGFVSILGVHSQSTFDVTLIFLFVVVTRHECCSYIRHSASQRCHVSK